MTAFTQEISIKLLTVHDTLCHVPGLPLCVMKQLSISIQNFLYSDVMKPRKYYRRLLHRLGHLPKVLNLFIYIYLCISLYSMVFKWRLENNFQELVLSVRWAQGIKLKFSCYVARALICLAFTGPCSISDQNIL